VLEVCPTVSAGSEGSGENLWRTGRPPVESPRRWRFPQAARLRTAAGLFSTDPPVKWPRRRSAQDQQRPRLFSTSCRQQLQQTGRSRPGPRASRAPSISAPVLLLEVVALVVAARAPGPAGPPRSVRRCCCWWWPPRPERPGPPGQPGPLDQCAGAGGGGGPPGRSSPGPGASRAPSIGAAAVLLEVVALVVAGWPCGKPRVRMGPLFRPLQMAALDLTDIPSNINTFERLLSWAAMCVQSLGNGAEVNVVTNAESLPLCQVSVNVTADGVDRFVVQAYLPIDRDALNDPDEKTWMAAQDVATAQPHVNLLSN